MFFGRWKVLMKAFGLSDNAETYEALIEAYSEKHRAYHTFEHIAACLRNLDAVRSELKYPYEVELALWFHDAVYKPFSSSNEKNSAIWTQEFFELNEFDQDDVIERVYDLVMVTEHHGETSTNDERILLDIDLSILGAQPDIYDQFEKNVRHEYKRVPGLVFRKKRKAILSDFLHRDPIFHHPYFYERLEDQARINLEGAIARL